VVKAVVLVKQVPNTEEVRIDDSTREPSIRTSSVLGTCLTRTAAFTTVPPWRRNPERV
jgi:hypothetical protein